MAKKIYHHGISMTLSYNEGSGNYLYEVNPEGFECEYSDEWMHEENPIQDYVRNFIENDGEGFEDKGYTWDDGDCTIDFSTVTFDGSHHILYKDGVPVELYYIK